MFAWGVKAEGFALGAAVGDDLEPFLDLGALGFAAPETGFGRTRAPAGQVDNLCMAPLGHEAEFHFFLADEARGSLGHV